MSNYPEYSLLKKGIMMILQNVAYKHPDREILFSNLDFSLPDQDKIALVGNNGAGKSTLLRILAGELLPSEGSIKTTTKPYYVPQLSGQFKDQRVAQALGVYDKLKALREILSGNPTETNLALVGDDWLIEERCKEALARWQLDGLDPHERMSALSGGEKTKVLLAGIMIHDPQTILLDEPSNHLDRSGRTALYDLVESTKNSLVVVSHDRKLLSLLPTVYELDRARITVYGGNYDFYVSQKMTEQESLQQRLREKEKTFRKAKETARASVERQQKLDARAKKKQPHSGIPTISINSLRNNAEQSTARTKSVHAGKVEDIAQELSRLRHELPDMDKMKADFGSTTLHRGKILVRAEKINFAYHEKLLWQPPLSFQIMSGERVAIRGRNGSGKTTLVKLILGEIRPEKGSLHRAMAKTIYIDQDYALINPAYTVYEQAQQYNSGSLQEHEIKLRLNRFLFGSGDWNKSCTALSGGEKMRLILCSLTISNHMPDIIVLDEPTNNLDIQNIEILTAALREYRGTILAISHDDVFLKEINATRAIFLGE